MKGKLSSLQIGSVFGTLLHGLAMNTTLSQPLLLACVEPKDSQSESLMFSQAFLTIYTSPRCGLCFLRSSVHCESFKRPSPTYLLSQLLSSQAFCRSVACPNYHPSSKLLQPIRVPLILLAKATQPWKHSFWQNKGQLLPWSFREMPAVEIQSQFFEKDFIPPSGATNMHQKCSSCPHYRPPGQVWHAGDLRCHRTLTHKALASPLGHWKFLIRFLEFCKS